MDVGYHLARDSNCGHDGQAGGQGSADMVINASFTTGQAAYVDLSATVDLSSIDSIRLWAKSAASTVAGELELVVDDTAGCGSALENIDFPVLVAGTWKHATLSISANSDMTAVKCVGLSVLTDNRAQTVNLDDISGQGQATSLLITLINALAEEPVDATEPSDSGNDGLSDTDSVHTLILSYTDKNQVVKGIYWTKTFLGNNDGDNLIEAGEKLQITVQLKGLANANPVTADTKFDVEFRPEDGGVLVVERTMPNIVDTVMNLN